MMESYLDVFNEKSLQYATKLEKFIEINSENVDIFKLMTHLTLDIVCGNDN